ncbi:MAG TPA: restriction endonuclease subunit S, partial [Candidatus Nanoarchaeia archaeon]|nr:restriction endonuclease subunit S [Candidatus Nanoarchaeia archaeon]
QRPAGQPNINAEEYKSLTFPLPPFEIQKKVVKIFSLAYEQKKQNEAEAEKLLASIDDYLMKELGITLPTPPENILKNRIFTSSLNGLSGNRYDPHFHQAKFKEIEKHLYAGKFPISKLKKVSTVITSGATPKAGGDAYTDDTNTGIPFIRSGEINEIDFGSALHITREIHNSMLKSSQLKKRDLLIAIVGATIGQIGIYNYDREANINQAIAVVRLKNEIEVEFAESFLKSALGKSILDRIKRPVARANINLDEIGIIPIPVPPLAKQKEIAEHITDIRKQAQQLKDKTKEELKKASEEIEKILLT